MASGSRHGDNLGSMLLGGLVLATHERLLRIDVPAAWHCALVHPHVVLETRKARAALAGHYALGEFVAQSSNLALVLAGCYRGDAALVREGLKDVLVEPRRAPLIPNFAKVKQAALDHHALGASISGAGPSVFGWYDNRSRCRSGERGDASGVRGGRAGQRRVGIADQWAGCRTDRLDRGCRMSAADPLRYHSTRGDAPAVPISQAIAAGLAPDGGLYVPEALPTLDPAAFDPHGSLADTAATLLAPFFAGDALADELPAICVDAFTFDAPLRPLPAHPATLMLELFHGPTSAFKDFGARFLAACLRRLPRGDARPLTILVATSGDTGAAVAAAFHRQPNVNVVILYPDGLVSPRQAHQLGCFGDNVTRAARGRPLRRLPAHGESRAQRCVIAGAACRCPRPTASAWAGCCRR